MTLVYPGSFDPVTLGHIDIALRGAKLADRLIVAVLDNPNKRTLFTVNERVKLLKDAFRDTAKIEVSSFSGLLANYVELNKANAILRGLRNAGDFESESQYAVCNKMLSEGIDTIFLPASPHYAHISSSIVREITLVGDDKHLKNMNIPMVTPATYAALLAKKSKGER
ncbi:MAG: pantetheine-phosphate adenylyltransferase [Defluviitaleaceae bacterium]|nr:pantetheine-phosphate adenylyltransferase [Defluviitaleaceae bacterium]